MGATQLMHAPFSRWTVQQRDGLVWVKIDSDAASIESRLTVQQARDIAALLNRTAALAEALG